MKNLTMKRVLAGVLGAATMIASSLTMASACTTIYAGANRNPKECQYPYKSKKQHHIIQREHSVKAETARMWCCVNQSDQFWLPFCRSTMWV